MSHSISFDSTGSISPARKHDEDFSGTFKSPLKKNNCVSPCLDRRASASKKRRYLQQVSPNVSSKTILLNTQQTQPPEKKFEIRQSAFPRPTLQSSIGTSRSKTSLQIPGSFSPHKNELRRTNSLILGGSNDSIFMTNSSFDRFIPSRSNSTSGKLQIDTSTPHPNASPQTHIKAQASKIYQHKVAEACGLEMNTRILQFQPAPPERTRPIDLFSHLSTTSSSKAALNSAFNKSLRPAMASARAKKIPSAPERVLDAPGLVDDFYLNLLSWSSTNLLAIGLGDAVYVWNASTGSVGLLCELPNNTIVSSLRWSDDGSYVSVGKEDGIIEIWDIESNSKLRSLNCKNHHTRIASQAWNQHILTSGSRAGHIYHSDVRVADHLVNQLKDSHSAEICGLEYKSDSVQFCSGGNDNLVCIWDVRQTHSSSVSTPLFTKHNHKAAVKALSWCPYQSSLLATGGGSSDKSIHFWNSSTGARVNTIETGSQISSINWGYASGTGMEIVATHGFPTNNISLYNYPTLQKTGEILTAHDSRILTGCLSPDSMTLATVAADENLKFWSLFDFYKSSKRNDNDLEEMGSSGVSCSNKRMKKLMSLR